MNPSPNQPASEARPTDRQPAFPIPAVGTGDPRDGMTSGSDGMELRDYFAAKAMSSIMLTMVDCTQYPSSKEVHKSVAELAFSYADAMMKARAL